MDDKTSKNYLKKGTKFENLNEKFEIISQIPQWQQWKDKIQQYIFLYVSIKERQIYKMK